MDQNEKLDFENQKYADLQGLRHLHGNSKLNKKEEGMT